MRIALILNTLIVKVSEVSLDQSGEAMWGCEWLSSPAEAAAKFRRG